MSKESEAYALMKCAKKAHTKTLTKWSADWDVAATDYEKAAKIFTHLKNTEMAREAWLATSYAHEKARNHFFAAKAIESLAAMLKDDENYMNTNTAKKEVSDLYIKASNMFALDNKPERQSDALQRAAALTPASDAKGAADKLHLALDALEESDKYHYTPDIYRSLITLEVRSNLLMDAINTLRREIVTFEKLNQPAGAAKAGLEIIVLILSMGDWVFADREFKSLQDSFGFPHSKEQGAAFGLIAAIEERDEEQLVVAIKDQTFQFIIPDIARIAKRLKVTGVVNIPEKRQNVVGAESTEPHTAAADISSVKSPRDDNKSAKLPVEDHHADEEDLR